MATGLKVSKLLNSDTWWGLERELLEIEDLGLEAKMFDSQVFGGEFSIS